MPKTQLPPHLCENHVLHPISWKAPEQLTIHNGMKEEGLWKQRYQHRPTLHYDLCARPPVWEVLYALWLQLHIEGNPVGQLSLVPRLQLHQRPSVP